MTIKGVSRRAAWVLMMASACAMFTAEARAQGTVHMPLDKAVISGPMAKKALVKDQLSADLAQDIVNECVNIAKASGGTLSVFVLAPDGEILAAHRMDGQNKINTVTGYKKAQTALWLRIPTHQAVNQFRTAVCRSSWMMC
jgi:Haem degrading protein HbpS-like